MIFHTLSFKYFQRKFWGILRPPASNVNTKFSTFCGLKFSLFYKFSFLSHFSLKIVIFSWVLEFLQNILALSLKQDLVYSQLSIAEERFCFLGFFCFCFRFCFFVFFQLLKRSCCTTGLCGKGPIKYSLSFPHSICP